MSRPPKFNPRHANPAHHSNAIRLAALQVIATVAPPEFAIEALLAEVQLLNDAADRYAASVASELKVGAR